MDKYDFWELMKSDNEFKRPVGKRPEIKKLGTIDIYGAEATPFVLNGKLYRMESTNKMHYANKLDVNYFRIVDAKTRYAYPPFAHGCEFGCAYLEDETLYVVGSYPGGGNKIKLFWSKDFVNWEEKTIFDLPGWEIFNTSVCKVEDSYIMAIEIKEPKERTGVYFTINFATSSNMMDWEMMDKKYVHTKERYAACPSIRYYDEYYYMVYCEEMPAHRYIPYVARSKDLIDWEIGIHSPFIMMDDDDKIIKYPDITDSQRKALKETADISNSDIDFCEWQGKTYILYIWGNQLGLHCLAEAEYDGSEKEMLEAFFN